MSIRTRFLLIGAIATGLGLATACATRTTGPMAPPLGTAAGTWAPPKALSPGTADGSGTASTGPSIPDLRHEPEVNILLADGPRLTLTLLCAGEVGGRQIVPGTYVIMAGHGADIDLSGTALPPTAMLRLSGLGATFRTTVTPPFGPPQINDFAGDVLIRRNGERIQLIERVGLETYLAGVVPVEMNPNWPVEALKAQAIAARSYAAAKAVDRFDKPWQLHWHYTVDMAYAGMSAKVNPAVIEALRQTRGQFLMYHEHPLPALFHAASGGACESATNAMERMTTRSGISMAAQMPALADPACEGGCAGLHLMASHWRWKENLPGAKVLSGLRSWAHEHPEDHLRFGTALTNVKILSRHPDSQRVDQLEITTKDGRKNIITTMKAGDFRLAVGPGDMRSTWLDRCLVVAGSGKGSTLVLAGRGYGHGVGLSQVSAWYLAKQGESAVSILRRFYPTADFQDRY